MQKKRIYLDYAAATPVDPRVYKAMEPYFAEQFGNPGSLHSFGQRASAAVFTARQTVAAALGAHYQEIIFTASATEANNLALSGAVAGLPARGGQGSKKKIIISAIEHESVLNTAKELKKRGAEVIVIPVSKEGIVDLKKLKAALTKDTAVVSIMYANNETGVVEPIEKIAKLVREVRGANQYPLLHTDAVQAFQYLPCQVDELGIDLLTLSSQKICGPKGAGALYVRSKTKGVNRFYPVAPLLLGGGQEQGLRSGTENVPAIVGFGAAVELVEKLRSTEALRVYALREELWKGIKKLFPKAQRNGDLKNRLPNNLNFYIPGVSGEELLVALDLQGVAVSSGSACTARSIDPSHVLVAMGQDKVRAKNSLRLSLGRMTSRQEVVDFLGRLRILKGILT